MKPELQRKSIAEACGVETWQGDCPDKSLTKDGRLLPDYLNDLNAMHEAEKLIVAGNHIGYCRNVLDLVCPETKGVIVGLHAGYGISILHATAAQRAEAFLKTVGKWK